MQEEIAIKVDHVSKYYRIGTQKEGSLRDTLGTLFKKSSVKGEEFRALDDVSFEIKKGDVVGIIGKNGAGKSTLLKILSQITKPTKGRVEINGRIASLLEVGTGFHPDLTGRENIYLNGTILGMTRQEVRDKFDEIVAFSGVEKFIDTPVKNYSSGMYVRLAFAVAAHLEPEILIIDEVLAVGDAEFQKKCLGKMGEVAGEGKTVIFVSHDLAAVKKLCSNGILMVNGKISFVGNVIDTIAEYQRKGMQSSSYLCSDINEAAGNDDVKINYFAVTPVFGDYFTISSGVNVNLKFYNFKSNINLDVTFELRNNDDQAIFHTGTFISTGYDAKAGLYDVNFIIPPNLLNTGSYYFKLIFGENQRYLLFEIEQLIGFEIENEAIGSNSAVLPGVIRPIFDFNVMYHEKTVIF